MKNSIILLFVFLTTTASAQDNFKWPDHEVSPVFIEFLDAYNSNNFDSLSFFTDKYYPKDKSNQQAMYWAKIHSEYGTLIPFKIADEKFHGLPAIWFQGTDTKSWAKIVLMLNDDKTQIANGGVFKSMRPVGILPPYEAMQEKDMKNYLKGYVGNLSEQDLFSGSILVAQGDKVLFQKAYGFRNKEKKKKNKTKTAFGIASTTKTFTAIAIAQLAEQGKINFSDPLSKFIDEYPKDIADQVTIHHLLTHTSGLEFDDYDPFYYETLEAKSIDEMLKIQLKYIENMNENRRKDFTVLNKFDYSNDNFILLGAIIERITGGTYAEYIENNILKASHMSHTIVTNETLLNYKNRATAYSHNNNEMEFQLGDRRKVNGSAVCNIIMPAGGIHASAKDLYRYFKGINQQQLISSESHEILFTKHAVRSISESEKTFIHYGYGFMLNQNGDAYSVGHGGVDYGVGSRFEYYPEQDIYVIVLSNYGSMAGNNIADHIRDLIEPNK